jgi:hypothetical protein
MDTMRQISVHSDTICVSRLRCRELVALNLSCGLSQKNCYLPRRDTSAWKPSKPFLSTPPIASRNVSRPFSSISFHV